MVSVAEACKIIEGQGLLERSRANHSERIIERVKELLGREVPDDLKAFYRERVEWIGQFAAISPIWNDHVGWRPSSVAVTDLMHISAVPVFFDGFGNLFGLDLRNDGERPAVYFFDHDHSFSEPEYAVGSSLGAFMLLLANHDRAFREHWPEKWELSIDADIEHCRRAPAIWDTD